MRSVLNSNSCLSSEEKKPDQLRLYVRDKIRELEMEMAEIKTAKETFLKNFSITNKVIENMTKNISRCIEESGETLKRRLEDIRKEKITEWDRQLELCLQAEKNIAYNAPGISATFSAFDEAIGFIDSGDIKFEEDMSILIRIKNFGTLLAIDRPLRPKIVIGGGGQKRMGFSQPWGVCSDPTGRILVADRDNNRIQVFNEFGEFIFHFGEPGSRPGEFRHPSGIAIDKKLRIAVSDTRNHRIQVFTYKGGFLTAFGQKGTGVGQFRSPHDVAVNEYCDIAVSDTKNRRIQLFTPHGEFITQFCFAPKLNICPWRVAFWADASLMVTDAQNHHRLFTIDKYFTTANTLDGTDLTFCKRERDACNRSGGFGLLTKIYDEEGALCGLLGGKLNSVEGVCFKRRDSFAAAGKNSVLVF